MENPTNNRVCCIHKKTQMRSEHKVKKNMISNRI